MISFGSLDLTLIDMYKEKFKSLFGECKSYLYVVIFNDVEGKKRELLKKNTKTIFIEKGVLVCGF